MFSSFYRYPNFGRDAEPTLLGEVTLTGHAYGPVHVTFVGAPIAVPGSKDRLIYTLVSVGKSDGVLFTWSVEV